MIVLCTNCNASYNIPDEKAPKQRMVATCKKCQHKIVIEPDPVIEPIAGITGPHATEPSKQAIETFNNLLMVDFPKLRSMPEGRYAFWKIFLPGPEGGFKTRPNKRKIKLLRAIDPILDGLLYENEKVLFIETAIARSVFDILLVNRWFAGLYDRYALIGTGQRLLMINVDKGHKKKLHRLYQLPYRSIASVSRGLFKKGIVLKPGKGNQRAFRSMMPNASEALYSFLSDQLERNSDREQMNQPDEFICPACYKPFQNATNACPNCTTEFKNPVGAALRSLILPGWGNFYLGRRLLGILEMLISICLWLIVLDAFLANNQRMVFMALRIIAIFNGCDGILTFFAARQGYSLLKVPKEAK